MRMRLSFSTLVLATAVLGTAQAQNAPAQSTAAPAPVETRGAPAFDVASVKVSPPSKTDLININLGNIQHGTLSLTNASLADCLRFAYSLSSNSQLAGPDWITSKAVRFDIVAKAAPETPREDELRMLQALLNERFKLVFHREPKEMSYYALVVGRNGPKLQPESEDAPPFDAHGLRYIAQPHLSMMMLGTLISRFELQAPVIDMTGIPGRYQVKLEWSPANASPDAPAGPSIFTAVQEQLGLKLEARKGPVEILVIDHAEKIPTEN